MLTSWGKKVVACAKIINYTIPFVTVTATSPAMIEAKNVLGSTYYIPPVYYTQTWAAITAALADTSYGIALGSGDTAPTENDYTLANQITGFTMATPTITTFFDTTNFKYVARLDMSVSNNTGSPITIKEVGYFVRFNTNGTRGANATASNAARHSFMIDRSVLETPLTIANGAAAVVRYDFAYEG